MQNLFRLVLLLLALPVPGSAGVRVEIVATNAEERVPQSRVCFFPAKRDDGFFEKFLSSNDIRCMSADSIIDVPAGLFNVFAQKDALVSSHPDFIDNERPCDGFSRLAINLYPAAFVDVSTAKAELPPESWLAFYLSNSTRPDSPASLRPIPDDATAVTLPAGMPVVPLIVRNGAILRAGRPITLRPAERLELDGASSWGAATDVIALVRSESPEEERNPQSAPSVELLDASGAAVRPVIALRDAGLFERSLAIFKDVAPGEHVLRLSGPGWVTDELPISVAAGRTVVTRPLIARAAAVLSVRSSTGPIAGNLRIACPGEGIADEDEALTPTLTLLHCGTADHCEPAREVVAVSQSDSVHVWDDLEPGRYAVELRYQSLSERTEPMALEPGAPIEVGLGFAYGRVIGRVRRGTTPVRALVEFDHSILPAVSDEGGNYAAIVENRSRRSVVHVKLCGGGAFEFLPREPVSGVLDIEIPENELVARVLDHRRRPVAGAIVHGGPLTEEGEAENVSLTFPETDAEGFARVDFVPTDSAIRVCAAAPPVHKLQCAPDFTMTRGREHVEIEFRSSGAFSGRIRASAPIIAGKVWLMSPAGSSIDTSAVKVDGEFLLARPPESSDYMVFVSLSHPLAILLPNVGGHAEFYLPAMTRSISVSLAAESRPIRIALEIGGFVVPTGALRRHQSLRRRQDELQPGTSVAVVDIAGSTSLAVFAVPAFRDYPPAWSGIDPLEVPALRATIPRSEVIAGSVRF